MQYMLLIHDDEGTWGAMSEEERQGLMGEYAAFSERLRSDGAMADGNRLGHSHTDNNARVSERRAIVQMMNSLRITFAAVAGEVDPIDFIAIEALRVFTPILYEQLRWKKDL